jgi:hypothetical protein
VVAVVVPHVILEIQMELINVRLVAQVVTEL